MRTTTATLTVLILSCASVHADTNWPQWRGPHGNGVSASTGLPTQWSSESRSENIKWSTALPSWSGGSPVVWENRVFVTSPSKADGILQQVMGNSAGGESLLLLCLSRGDGSELWRHELDTGNDMHRKHNNTSPSPVTDGVLVWAVTGTGVVTALDMDGGVVWRLDLQETYGAFGLQWGYASSPLLVDDRLVVEVLHGQHTDDPSYVIAFDAAKGEVLWRQERPTDAVTESPDAYTTPAVIERNDHRQIVISGGDYVTGHHLETGAELWRLGGLNPEKRGNYRVVGSPVVAGDMLFVPTRKKPLQAFRLGGGVPDTDPVWTWDGAGAPDVPTPVADGRYFYMVDDRGMVTCLDAASGAAVWGPHRTPEGTVSASPVLADGKLYITNENGVTTVMTAGPQLQQLAVNELDGSYTLSSMAVAGYQLFIRTGTHLYCIGATQ